MVLLLEHREEYNFPNDNNGEDVSGVDRAVHSGGPGVKASETKVQRRLGKRVVAIAILDEARLDHFTVVDVTKKRIFRNRFDPGFWQA